MTPNLDDLLERLRLYALYGPYPPGRDPVGDWQCFFVTSEEVIEALRELTLLKESSK